MTDGGKHFYYLQMHSNFHFLPFLVYVWDTELEVSDHVINDIVPLLFPH